MVPPTSEAYAAFCNARALRKLRDASGSEELVLGDYPVEARLYRPGSSMAWHQDVVLYERPQVELIYTVVNDSDGRTEWVGSDGLVRGLAPPANSALVFEAGAAWHRVAASTSRSSERVAEEKDGDDGDDGTPGTRVDDEGEDGDDGEVSARDGMDASSADDARRRQTYSTDARHAAPLRDLMDRDLIRDDGSRALARIVRRLATAAATLQPRAHERCQF